jgi:integrase/recombinase XerD
MTKSVDGFHETLRRERRLGNSSRRAIKTYLSRLRSFIAYAYPKHAREAGEQEIRAYLRHLSKETKFSAGSADQVFNALRLVYAYSYRKLFVIVSLPRPRKGRHLPDVLSESEPLRLFGAVSNFKQRTVLMPAYAGGMRVNEVVRLRIEDVGGQRGLIHIRRAKGNRDLHTHLPESMQNNSHKSIVYPNDKQHARQHLAGFAKWQRLASRAGRQE